MRPLLATNTTCLCGTGGVTSQGISATRPGGLGGAPAPGLSKRHVYSALLETARREVFRDEEVRTVTTTGKVHRLTEVRIGERARHIFLLRTPKPESSISLRVPSRRHGLLAAAKPLREAFLGREGPWKPGSGAIEGEVAIKGGRIRRGFACLYCM